MNVFVANFKSTGQNWDTKVFKDFSALRDFMDNCGWNRTYANDTLSFMEYQDGKDKTQTATVSELRVIE